MAIQQGQITITGFAGNDPTLRGGQDESRSACRFRLASTRGYMDRNGVWREQATTWGTVKAFRTLALNVVNSVRKGDAVIVTGILTTETWRAENGDTRSSMIIEASNIGHDLNYGVSAMRKIAKSNEQTASPTQQGAGRTPQQGGGDRDPGYGNGERHTNAPVTFGAPPVDPQTGEVASEEDMAAVVAEAAAVAQRAMDPQPVGARDEFDDGAGSL